MDNKNLWATTTNGINKLNLETQQISYFENGPTSEFSNEYFSKILIQSDSTLWIGSDDGLCLFNKNSGSTKYYNVKDGLPSNTISSMVRDDLGNIWLSTENGISKFINSNNPSPPRFINYDTRDGLNSNTFNRNSAAEMPEAGNYILVQVMALILFFLRMLTVQNRLSGITNFFIKNNEITVNSPNSPLRKTYMRLTKLYLNMNRTVSDSALIRFTFQDQIRINLHICWKDSIKIRIYDNKSNVTYTNMDPGEYVFRVKGSNGDGFWNNEGKSIIITILKPWYTTYWAYFGYIIAFGLLVFGIDRFQRKRVLAKAREEMKFKDAEHRAQTAELQAEAAEAQAKIVQAENNRKTKELEEARQLQLSMLPKEIPQLQNLDIAVYMKTATEVGGDYYDFHISMNGTLTIVIGDATGHGMKAGTMVTTAKSLFNSYSSNKDILFSFHEISRCIKEMNYHNLSMCLTMLKIDNRNK
ncbi:MAG: triple tyrosine motif-containing protein [Melioribacteraceae bacterium]|nr:triple tyrosine motif-containing protein [Melioribacteraceae bacterium]